jgi:hypothetical protein
LRFRSGAFGVSRVRSRVDRRYPGRCERHMSAPHELLQHVIDWAVGTFRRSGAYQRTVNVPPVRVGVRIGATRTVPVVAA